MVLAAIGEKWSIEYSPSERAGITIKEVLADTLLIDGNLKDVQAVKDKLISWVSEKARSSFVPMVRSLAAHGNFQFKKVSIRHQRTRWGSCSTKGTISLNLRLIFLPTRLLRYVIVHELAHTREMNHSRRFWALVSIHEPEYKQLNAELRTAWRHLPEWLI